MRRSGRLMDWDVSGAVWRFRIFSITLVQEFGGTNFPPRMRIHLYPHQESIMWVQIVLSFAWVTGNTIPPEWEHICSEWGFMFPNGGLCSPNESTLAIWGYPPWYFPSISYTKVYVFGVCLSIKIRIVTLVRASRSMPDANISREYHIQQFMLVFKT